jgi:hypothetical protein
MTDSARHRGVPRRRESLPWKALLVVVSWAGGTSEGRAQAELFRWTSSNWNADYDMCGYSVTGVPDVDGDGIPDALVSVVSEDLTRGVELGAAYVVSTSSGTVLQHQTGSFTLDRFGDRVCEVDDFDGDGIRDYLVAETQYGLPMGNGKGIVHAYSSASGASLFDITALQSDDRFGFYLADLGDLDADGIGDFAIGAPEHTTSVGFAGRVWIYSGATQTKLHMFSGQSQYAYMAGVTGMGDLDGDGVPDFAIASPGDGPNNEGMVYVYSGSSFALIYSLQGEKTKDAFGWDISSLGDTDGDGYSDLAVAAIGHTLNLGAEGRVYVYSGLTGSLRFTYDGTQWIEALGQLPTKGGIDFNGDGFMDIAIGSPWAKGDGQFGGDVYVYSGRNGLLLYDIRGEVNPYGEGLGGSLSAIGDVNGDGFDDLLVGAPQHSIPWVATWHGQAYVFGGNDLFLQANRREFDAYDAATLDLRGGPAGALACIVLTAVGKTATFVPIVINPLDANGNLSIGGSVPSGLAGTNLTFTGYAVGAGGQGVIDSIPETISFQ